MNSRKEGTQRKIPANGTATLKPRANSKTERFVAWRDVLDSIFILIASPILFQIPVTIRLNERDDQQMIARLNRFEILDQMSEQCKHVLPEE